MKKITINLGFNEDACLPDPEKYEVGDIFELISESSFFRVQAKTKFCSEEENSIFSIISDTCLAEFVVCENTEGEKAWELIPL